MPTYQYSCTDCGAGLERWQRFSDAPLTLCPACGGGLRKVISPVGVIFKGSGWYCTDSRSKSNGESSDFKAKSDGESSTKKEPVGAAA